MKDLKIGLSDKPSVFFKQVAKDFRVMSYKHNIDMDIWFDNQDDNKCEVCLAGAVVLSRMGKRELTRINDHEGVDPGTLEDYDHISYSTGEKLRALNFFRSGMPNAFAANFKNGFRRRAPANLIRFLDEFKEVDGQVDEEDIQVVHEALLIASDICKEAGM